jgi:hypothetical protein
VFQKISELLQMWFHQTFAKLIYYLRSLIGAAFEPRSGKYLIRNVSGIAA